MLVNLRVIPAISFRETSVLRVCTVCRLAATVLIAGGLVLAAPQAGKAATAPEPAPIAARTIPVGHMLSGRFVLNRRLAGFSKELRSEGTFILVPDRGLIWRVATPFASTTAITPSGVLQITGGEEAMRLPASSQPGLSQLFTVLSAAVSGDIARLETLFTVRQTGAAPRWQIVLEPLTANAGAVAQLTSLTLTGSEHVEAADIDKGGGDTDHILFSGQTVTPATLSSDDIALLDVLSR